jgi:hypothetical protein
MEFKLVINWKDGRAVVGASAPDCDPVFGTIEGDIPTVLGGAVNILAAAQERWKTAPKNPAITLPKPAAPAPAPAPSGSKPAGKAASKPSTPQTAMF